VGREIDIDSDLPQYILRGSEEEENWRLQNPGGYRLQGDNNPSTTGSTEAHVAAMHNDVTELRRLLHEQMHLAESRDTNGWTALHEAARGGHAEAIQVLLDAGADINARTRGRDGLTGGSVLYWAIEHGANPKVLRLLLDNGAKNFHPESHTHTEL
jgi:ankyrin repeat protein